LAVKKMQDQGLSRTECRKRVKAVNDAKTLVDTFTKMDQNGKKKCEVEGTRCGTVTQTVDLIEASDGTSGKKGVSPSALSAHSDMRLKMQMQELKSKDWDIIK
jgi:hypothetical protein